MEAKLLFPSGSTTINTEGKSALVQLRKVLESQEDLTILVEGHTDTDKMKGTGCIKDNWELSVMRATAVVKLMMNSSKIDVLSFKDIRPLSPLIDFISLFILVSLSLL